jgi:hypothetical protein
MANPEWWLSESQWLAGPTVAEMTDFIADVGSERKLRWFVHACCERVGRVMLDPRIRIAHAAVARYADGECTRDELGVCWNRVGAAKAAVEAPLVRDGCLYTTAESLAASAVLYACNPSYVSAFRKPFYRNATVTAAANAALVAAGSIAYERTERRSDSDATQAAEAAAQSCLLCDIFGNPFRSAIFSPSWRTDTALALVRQIYESREFGAMPILADALQDAGCDNTDVLNHCRDANQVHVRGCWVVDLVLGKE